MTCNYEIMHVRLPNFGWGLHGAELGIYVSEVSGEHVHVYTDL